MAETQSGSGSAANTARVEPGPALAGRARHGIFRFYDKDFDSGSAMEIRAPRDGAKLNGASQRKMF